MTLEELRAERNSRLESSDFYMLPDVHDKLSTGRQEIVLEYRQALRDFPSQYSTNDEPITEVTWPDLLM